MYQLDVKNTFLYGDLLEEVFMKQPPGYVAQGETRVCKLKKTIYGLKQSPRAWFNKFNKVAMQFDFQMCNFEHLIFIRQRSTGYVILAIYVDNILVTESNRAGVDESRAFLKKHFVTKDIARLRYFLGI